MVNTFYSKFCVLLHKFTENAQHYVILMAALVLSKYSSRPLFNWTQCTVRWKHCRISYLVSSV